MIYNTINRTDLSEYRSKDRGDVTTALELKTKDREKKPNNLQKEELHYTWNQFDKHEEETPVV